MSTGRERASHSRVMAVPYEPANTWTGPEASALRTACISSAQRAIPQFCASGGGSDLPHPSWSQLTRRRSLPSAESSS